MRYLNIATLSLFMNLAFGQVTVDPTSVTFGGVPVGQTANISVQITSEIAQTITFTDIEDPFSISPSSIDLGVNESETITVSFSPSEIGNYDDVATVDASVFGDTSFDITGEGTQVEISLSTFNVTFDNCSVGDSSLHTVTIGNEGVGTLTVSDIISSDANFHARPRNLYILR